MCTDGVAGLEVPLLKCKYTVTNTDSNTITNTDTNESMNTNTNNDCQFQTYVYRWGGGAGSPASQAEDPREDLRKGFSDSFH